MCESPVLIKNPAYRGGASSHFRHTDDVSPTIVVPCGHCNQCASNKSIFLSQRLEIESLSHWVFFFTFTCKDEFLIREDFGDVVLSRYPVDVLTKCIKRFRHLFEQPDNVLYNRSFRYYYLNEYGSSYHRPHIHGFFLIEKDDKLSPTVIERYIYNWWKTNLCINIGSFKFPAYVPIFDFIQCYHGGKLVRNYDLRFVDVKSRDSFGPLYYINKYLFKADKYVQYMWQVVYNYHDCPQEHTVEFTDFQKHWNLFRPRVRKSLNFGFPNGYIDFDMVNQMAEESFTRGLKSASFISPINNSSLPLSPYYKQYIAPRILDKFTESEYIENGFVLQKVNFSSKKSNFSPNLFDFTDLL